MKISIPTTYADCVKIALTVLVSVSIRSPVTSADSGSLHCVEAADKQLL